MDPLSVVAGCVGLLSSIAGLSSLINRFIGDIRGSRRDMEAVSHELASLTICLELLRNDCDNPAVRYPMSFRENLVNILRNCQSVITEIGDLMRKMSDSSLGRRIQWAATAQDDMNKLRLRLGAHKGAVKIALDTLQILLIREVKEGNEHIIKGNENILEDTHVIRQDTSWLPEMRNDVSQIPKLVEEIAMLRLQVETLARPGTQDNILMQRFLDDTATTYADSERADMISRIDDFAYTKQEDIAGLGIPSDEDFPRLYDQAVHDEMKGNVPVDSRVLSSEEDANYSIFPHEKGASADETARLRDEAPGSALQTLGDHPGPVNTVVDDRLKETLHEDPEPSPAWKFQEMSLEYRLVIAIDYGVTYTGVAFATPNTAYAILDEIDVVSDWGPMMGLHDKIPSIISYSRPSAAGERQWGASISPDAEVLVNTKLELDVQDDKSDELDLILQLLHGTRNLNLFNIVRSRRFTEYFFKAPEDILTDYLHQVFQWLCCSFILSPSFRDIIPVDIAITVPVNWSYRGINSMFRAVRNAGFNENTFPNLRDVIMVTELDAATIYAAKYLREDTGRQFLAQGECFVLCDVGDEKVNSISYIVTQLEPVLEFEPLTLPTVGECGFAYVDRVFKRWLHGLLGDKNYRILVPVAAGSNTSACATEGRKLREITQVFNKYKMMFAGNGRDMKMDLPEPLDDLTISDKVIGGELTITNEEMKSFFKPCLDQILDLLYDQIRRVEQMRGRRVRNIFLVGSFRESQYLYKEIYARLRLRQISLRSPDTTWTAVLRGAMIYGIQKFAHKTLTTMKSYPLSYGVMVNQVYSESKHDHGNCFRDSVTNKVMIKGQLTWLVQKGDLLLPNSRSDAEIGFAFNFRETDSRMFKLPIHEYPDDDITDKFGTELGVMNKVSVLNCDFSIYPISRFIRSENSSNGIPYYMAHCICKLVSSGRIVTVKIMWDEVEICSETSKHAQSQNIVLVLSPGTISPGIEVMVQPLITPFLAGGERPSSGIYIADKRLSWKLSGYQKRLEHRLQERCHEGRSQPKRDDGITRLKTILSHSLYGLRELIRTRCALDVEICALRERKQDCYIVERKMEIADAVLFEIITIVNAWEGTENLWTAYEWKQAKEVQARLQAEGKRWWIGNPVWEDD